MGRIVTNPPLIPVLLSIAIVAALWGDLLAQEPPPPGATSWLKFDDKTETLVDSSVRLPEGAHYRGAGSVIDIGGKGERCSFDIPAGITVEDVKIRVHSGVELLIRKSWLFRCQIVADHRSVVRMVDCGLDECELGGKSDEDAGVSTFKLTNCVLVHGRFLNPINTMGLEMQDCAVFHQKDVPILAWPARRSLSKLAREPIFRYTTFNNCQLGQTVLAAAAHCTFDRCTFLGGDHVVAPGSPLPDVGLPVSFQACTPDQLPVLGQGVILQPTSEPFGGGCSLPFTWNGDKPEPDDKFRSFTNASIPLREQLLEGGMKSTAPPPIGAVVMLPQTHVNGLLVSTLGGKEAGAITKMNLTALPGPPGVAFTQNVGEQMTTALEEVKRFMSLRHKALPPEHTLRIAFEEKYSGKDGPSAAVACGLLMESSFTGKVFDPTFAVTGDMNADGSVQPIGGVAAKLRGAIRGACKILAIPSRNESAIADLVVREGPAPLVGITVFAITHFDQACVLAEQERSPLVQAALSEMEAIRTVLQRDPRTILANLRTPQAAARLQSVLEKAPHCLSAKYLLLISQGRSPTALTLAGSIEAADNDAQSLVSAINRDIKGAVSSLQQDELGSSLTRLRNLRPRLDQRVWPYVDGLIAFGDTVRGVIINPLRSVSRAQEFEQQANRAAASAESAKKRLLTDSAVREELGL